MAHKQLVVALGMIVAASPLPAAQPDSAPIVPSATGAAPAGSPDTRYCMHVDPNTGSLIQTTECWTRDQWAEQGVDVDKEWARNGVKIVGPVSA
jgi:hypothetical protein